MSRKQETRTQPPKTGWPSMLLQDDDRKLFQWFASRPDARYVLRKVCAEIRVSPNTNSPPSA